MRWAGCAHALLISIGVFGAIAGVPVRAAEPSASYAEQITAVNVSQRLVGGSDATGGIGDWALGNGVLCAVVSDPSHESHLTPEGGVLIDLGHCGLAHDEWVTLEGLLNLSRERMLGASWIRAEASRPDGSVALITGSRVLGLDLETRYRLAPDRPHVLRIESQVKRLDDGEGGEDSPRAFLLGGLVLHGRRQLAPFTLHLDAAGTGVLPGGSVGFAHPAVDPDDMLTMVQAILPSQLHVLVGGDAQQPGVAYGLRLSEARLIRADGREQVLPSLSINGESFTMQGIFTRPFFVGGNRIGWLELAQTLLMDISPGDVVAFTREIVVGKRADVASVTDQLWAEQPLVRGVADPTARVHIDTEAGVPVSEVRPDGTGAFSLRLREGRYRLRVRAAGERRATRMFSVGPGVTELGRLELEPAARVILPRGRPMRLVFLRPPGSPERRVRFGDDELGFRIGDEAFRGSQYGPDVSLSGSDADPEQLTIAPGRYRVIATRGPEYSLTETRIEVSPGRATGLQIESPVRVLAHPGWVSADLHVHSEWSDDSNFPIERQLAAFVAGGADWIVSTEHDRVTDYAPLIRRLGLADRLTSRVGVEVTSSAHAGDSPETAGHANVFPLHYDAHAFRGGAPYAEGRRLRAMIGDARRREGRPLVQLNHPRRASGGSSDLNFFTHLSVAGEPYRPSEPLNAWPNRVLLEPEPGSGLRDLDFDLIEMWNGDSMDKYRAVRSDWYSLLLQGEFRPAVANSDSHVRSELIGYPRTYIQMPEHDDQTAPDAATAAFVDSLRAGRVYGSSGPLLDLALVAPDGPRTAIGGLHAGRSAVLHVRVEAASWVPVSKLVVRSNGVVVHTAAITPGGPVEIPLAFDTDAFVTVEVSGKPVGDYALVAPGFVPFAFSNPIFVDANGDARFTAPGLPAKPLPILDPSSPD